MKQTHESAAPELDDYQQLAAEQVIVAEKLCAAIALTAGTRVLDIGCGTGHAAIAAARRRAVVTAIDVNENSLARARVRTVAEGLTGIDFLNADATAMPFEDASFDIVLSTLGVVFLPDQEAAARELARVVRPGGTVALTAYTRQSIPSLVYDLGARLFAPPNPPSHPHYAWSDGERVRQLLGPYFHAIRVQYDSFDTSFASSQASFDHVSRWNPNIRKVMMHADTLRAEALRSGYIDILDRHNRATDGTFMAGMDYAVITAVRSV